MKGWLKSEQYIIYSDVWYCRNITGTMWSNNDCIFINFCVDLVVNRTLQEFKNDKNIQKVLKIAMLSSYVCVLSTVFCAIIAGFKGV